MKERGLGERCATHCEAALAQLHAGLARPRALKRLAQVRQRSWRWQARVAASCRLVAAEADPQAVTLTGTRRPQDGSPATHPGVHGLRSSATDWDADAFRRTCATLTAGATVCRSLQAEFGLRPLHRHQPRRADGHLCLTILAYQLVQVSRTHGEHANWTTLRRILENQQRATATCRRPAVRPATQAEPAQRTIHAVLGVNPHPGGVRQTFR